MRGEGRNIPSLESLDIIFFFWQFGFCVLVSPEMYMKIGFLWERLLVQFPYSSCFHSGYTLIRQSTQSFGPFSSATGSLEGA